MNRHNALSESVTRFKAKIEKWCTFKIDKIYVMSWELDAMKLFQSLLQSVHRLYRVLSWMKWDIDSMRLSLTYVYRWKRMRRFLK